MKESKNADKIGLSGTVRADHHIDRSQLELLYRRNAFEALDGDEVERICGHESGNATIITTVLANLSQSPPAQPLQNLYRRILPPRQTLAAHNYRLLQRILPRQNRMRHHIGEHHPRRVRRELEPVLCAAFLILAVEFQIIMEAQHEPVIRRPFRIHSAKSAQ